MKPMLAYNKEYDLSLIKFPVIASFKLDGIRALVKDGILVSRALKSIPNESVQRMFRTLPEGTDGELICGEPFGDDVMGRTSSAVMTRTGTPDVYYHVFDNFAVQDGFVERLRVVEQLNGRPNVKVVEHEYVQNLSELLEIEQQALDLGYEGLIVRSPYGVYKQGRSTLNEGYMLKVKRFVDAEAKIFGVYELMHNDNVATTNGLGRTERSRHKANMRAGGVLGGFDVIGINGDFKDVEFCVGGKFTAAERKKFWEQRDSLVGRTITYKYFPISVKDKPRFPGFKAFRDERDIS